MRDDWVGGNPKSLLMHHEQQLKILQQTISGEVPAAEPGRAHPAVLCICSKSSAFPPG